MSQIGEKDFRVLVPLALESAGEEEVLASLGYLVRGIKGPVHFRLYHALRPESLRLSWSREGSFLQQIELLRAAAETKLQQYVALLRERLPASAQVDIWVESQEVADPADEIVAYLQREAFTLMVTTFKHRKKWERFFGTTTLWDLLEKAPVPLLLVPNPLTLPPRRILWATELKPEEYRILHTLIPLIRQWNATLYCVRVNTPYRFQTHRGFQRHVLDLCDYIIEHVDPEFVPEECLLYADKNLSEGILHAAQDFMMDIVALHGAEVEAKIVDAFMEQGLPLLFLR
ncbi:MAG: universal stress protein [Bacteroidia bacterium]|nr:universal stress protein [Bacteroidia bacterium]MDW8089452.1 universal stress protein [Bacteroidia bacterium]